MCHLISVVVEPVVNIDLKVKILVYKFETCDNNHKSPALFKCRIQIVLVKNKMPRDESRQSGWECNTNCEVKKLKQYPV